MSWRIFWIALFTNAVASACLHFRSDFQGKVEEGAQYAFLYHDGKLAHLIIKTEVHTDTGKLPAEISWVVPFPAMPNKYEEVDATIFSELVGLVSASRNQSWGKALSLKDPSAAAGIIVHPVKEVGHYKVQEIEIASNGSGQEFNDWLKAHQYNPMPMEKQKIYLKKGAAFLAITVKLDASGATLKPLHIAYPSKKLSYPLKFTHDSRIFDINLFVFRERSFMNEPGNPPFLKYETQSFFPSQGVSLEKLKTLHSILGNRTGYIARYEGRKLNTEGRFLKDLAQDPSFDP